MGEINDYEARRLEALADYGVMDTPREASFDEIAALAARLCDAPIGVVNLIGDGRQFFKAEVGLGVRETPLESSFCAKAILEEEFLLIPDATQDPRFACNPLVTGEAGMRFYAGAVLKTDNGLPIGTLCVLDHRPRVLSDVQQETIRVLAHQAMAQLELRRALVARDREIEAARASEERLRLIVDSARDYAILTIDEGHRITSWSAGAEAAFGRSEADAVGCSFDELFMPEDRAAGVPAAEIRRAIAEGCAPDVRWHVRGDGTRVFMNGSTHPMLTSEPAASRGFLKIARNETDQRRQADELAQTRGELVESEARFRALFEAIDDGFCIIEFFDGPHGPSSDYVHVEANPGYERHTGIADIVGQTVRQLAPAEADGWVELYGQVLRTGETLRFERFFETAGRFIEVSASRVEPPSRRQVSVLFRDVNARKLAETALRASEALARENIQRVQLALAAGAIVGTWHWDLPTDRFTVDEGFARAFGIDPALGRDGLSLAQVVATVHPDDQAGLAAAIDEVILRGGAYAHQYRVRRADGRYYWIEANGRVDHGPDGTPLSFPGVLLDVEERRSVEEERDRATAALRALSDTLEQRVLDRTAELMAAEEQLRQSQKIEAVGQLTGGVAHDFNNLLTVIRGSVDLLQRPNITEERRAKYIAAISDTADRATKLTSQLLAFARRQALNAEVFDVADSIGNIREMLGTLTGSRIRIAVETPHGAFPVRADRSQFDTALVNMAVNARDAMNGEGVLTIGIAEVDGIPAVRSHPFVPGSFVAVAITDTGSGIPADQVDRIFEPFYTTKGVGHGTGLGLSQVFGFAKQSSGDVLVDSVPGQGSSFTLYLPRATEAGPADGSSSDTDFVPLAPGARILVVEDNDEVGSFALQALGELGHRTILAADAASALVELGRKDAGFDLVFSDVVMPGMSGIELEREIRSRHPGLPVVLTSGYSSVLAEQDRHDFEILKKPYSLTELARVLARAAARTKSEAGEPALPN
ncbi:PAS domain S-box protein [Sphingomonas sp. RS2018]